MLNQVLLLEETSSPTPNPKSKQASTYSSPQYLQILQKINQFTEFQLSIENKLLKIKEAITGNSIQEEKPFENGDVIDNLGFVSNLLKIRVTQLENEIT